MFRKDKKRSAQPDKQAEEQRLEQLAADPSEGETAAILREVSRLQLENIHLKRRNLRVWGANFVMGIGCVITVAGVLYAYPKYRWIPTTDNRAICEVTPEDGPRVSVADVTNFAKDAVLDSYTYGYVNYRREINRAAERWYTEEGRRAYMEGLENSGNLRRVIDGRLFLRSMATLTPQLEEITQGSNGTPSEWTVVVPIAIEFYEGGAPKPLSRQEFRASVTVVRVTASAANQKGIGVNAVVLMPPRN
ncbi:DotI/IcmL family type IV secretion protein [Castellaniella sp.]|uniref:DotI/IcmL family type IV secretion protein n=1 Tax=Castellaniella sp. TaxID=1955812 RepID=UPI002AFFBAC4|nr:DotI/IcmL family type IV secretion protein [Castellaniella sp.]